MLSSTEPMSFETDVKPMFRERDRQSLESPSISGSPATYPTGGGPGDSRLDISELRSRPFSSTLHPPGVTWH